MTDERAENLPRLKVNTEDGAPAPDFGVGGVGER